MHHLSMKIWAIIAAIILLSGSGLIIQSFSPQTSFVTAKLVTLSVSIETSKTQPISLGVDENLVCTAIVLNGTEPYSYVWTNSEGEVLGSGSELNFSFIEATETPENLTVRAVDSTGSYGSASIIIQDPYTHPPDQGNRQPMMDYIIQTDGKGWYEAVRSDGAIIASSINKTYVEQQAILKLDIGAIFLKNVTLDKSLNYNSGILIIESTNGGNKYYSNNSFLFGVDSKGFNCTTTLYATTIDEALTGSGVKLLKLVIENGTSFPSSPVNRQVFFRSDLGYLYIRNNSQWVQLGTTSYSNLTGKPDLTIYLQKDGTTALTGNWNIGGKYGVYGATWVNATNFAGTGQFWWNGVNRTDVVANPDLPISSFVYTNGTYYFLKNGSTSQIMLASKNASDIVQRAVNGGGTVYIKRGNYYFDTPISYSIPGTKITGDLSWVDQPYDNGTVIHPAGNLPCFFNVSTFMSSVENIGFKGDSYYVNVGVILSGQDSSMDKCSIATCNIGVLCYQLPNHRIDDSWIEYNNRNIVIEGISSVWISNNIIGGSVYCIDIFGCDEYFITNNRFFSSDFIVKTEHSWAILTNFIFLGNRLNNIFNTAFVFRQSMSGCRISTNLAQSNMGYTYLSTEASKQFVDCSFRDNSILNSTAVFNEESSSKWLKSGNSVNGLPMENTLYAISNTTTRTFVFDPQVYGTVKSLSATFDISDCIYTYTWVAMTNQVTVTLVVGNETALPKLMKILSVDVKS